MEPALLGVYQDVYSMFVSGKVDANRHRHDLGSHEEQRVGGVENIAQWMWPSDYVDGVRKVSTRGLKML